VSAYHAVVSRISRWWMRRGFNQRAIAEFRSEMRFAGFAVDHLTDEQVMEIWTQNVVEGLQKFSLGAKVYAERMTRSIEMMRRSIR
jgi:hypothetical protein